MAVLRSERPSDASSPSSQGQGPRAKALRPFEVRESTRSALYAYERAAKDYETMRLDSEPSDARALRTAASVLLDALCREHEDGNLPRALDADVERWIDGEFAGSDVDVEIANHAIFALLGSETCAELIDAA
jgi:hypothetical protein